MNHKVRSFSLIKNLILFCLIIFSLSGCGKKGVPGKVDLTEYFKNYPPLKEQNQIVFNEEELYLSLIDGWTKPKKKPPTPFLLSIGDKSSLRVFWGKSGKEEMKILCRPYYIEELTQQIKIFLNGKFISILTLDRENKLYSVKLPPGIVKPGLNYFTFQYCPIKYPQAKEKTRKRSKYGIAFEKIIFLPAHKGQEPKIEVYPEKQLVRFTGSISNYYFLRTYYQSKLSFYYRKREETSSQSLSQIRVIIENSYGQNIAYEFLINSKKWKKEEIDLSPFKNQLIKISFFHLTKGENSSEIKKPFLENELGKPKKSKILLIGLDGATWEVINPLIEQGKLPNLKKLIQTGVTGQLRTVRPWYSPLIWTSIVTGKKKEKHRITGFIDQQRKKGKIIPNSRLNRKCKTIWNILSNKGFTVGVIGLWVTWPAESINGYILSDRMFFENLPAITYPLELEYELFQKVKPLALKNRSSFFLSMKEKLKEDDFSLQSPLRKNIKYENLYLDQDQLKSFAGLYFNKKFNPDFFLLYIRGPDVTSHFFWKYFDPIGFPIPEEEIKKFGNLIPQNYIYQDFIIGKYLSQAGPNTLVIVVSDHGMKRGNYLPRVIFSQVEKLWKDTGLDNSVLNTQSRVNFLQLTIKESANRNKIISLLSQIKIGNKKSQLFKISLKKNNNIYLGINNPMEVEFNSSIFLNEKTIGQLSDYAQIKERSADHSLYGVLIMKGKEIKKGYQLKECSVLDIVPTLLYLLSLPVGKDMDGQVLVEGITSKFLAKNPINFIESYELEKDLIPLKENQIKRDESTDKKLIEQLRALGYIQ
ncbi:MAG: alkaline phosphatase family protein [Candidatus Aminicenantia bacterium]